MSTCNRVVFRNLAKYGGTTAQYPHIPMVEAPYLQGFSDSDPLGFWSFQKMEVLMGKP